MAGLLMYKTTYYDVTNFLNALEGAEQDEEIALPEFVRPYHLACTALKAKVTGNEINVREELVPYMTRMGLWNAIGRKAPISVTRLPCAGRFVETRVVEDDKGVHQTSIEISQMFERTGCNSETTDSLQILASELLGNCCAHSSEDEIFGMVTGQIWEGGNLAQLCIVDCGKGIRASLEGNEELRDRLNTEFACQMATEYGITGKPHGSHSGYGLTLTNDLITQNGGCLMVISENECYVNREGQVSVHTLDNGWQGTLIIFEWNTNISLDITQVYNSWPTSQALEEEEQYGELFN